MAIEVDGIYLTPPADYSELMFSQYSQDLRNPTVKQIADGEYHTVVQLQVTEDAAHVLRRDRYQTYSPRVEPYNVTPPDYSDASQFLLFVHQNYAVLLTNPTEEEVEREKNIDPTRNPTLEEALEEEPRDILRRNVMLNEDHFRTGIIVDFSDHRIDKLYARFHVRRDRRNDREHLHSPSPSGDLVTSGTH